MTGDNIVTRPDPGYHPNPGPGINPANPYQTLNITLFLRWNVPITLIERKDKRKLKYIKEKERGKSTRK